MGNEIAGGGNEICNMFKDNFTGVFSTPDDRSSPSHWLSPANPSQTVTPAVLCNLQFETKEIYHELMELDAKKAAGGHTSTDNIS